VSTAAYREISGLEIYLGHGGAKLNF